MTRHIPRLEGGGGVHMLIQHATWKLMTEGHRGRIGGSRVPGPNREKNRVDPCEFLFCGRVCLKDVLGMLLGVFRSRISVTWR